MKKNIPQEYATAYAKLTKELELAGGAPLSSDLASLPKSVPLSSIKLLPIVFQGRQLGGSHVDEYHVAALAEALEKEGKLTPLKVFPIGKVCYLIDGHHRYEAYKKVYRDPGHIIPVSYLSRREPSAAIIYAMKENSKIHLPLDRRSKLEYAWTVVRADCGFSLRQIETMCDISRPTIIKMKDAARQLKAEGKDEIFNQPWWSVVKYLKDEVVRYDDMTDDEKKVYWADIFNRLNRAMGKQVVRAPEEIFKAIAQEAPEAAKRMAEVAAAYLEGEDIFAFGGKMPSQFEDDDF